MKKGRRSLGLPKIARSRLYAVMAMASMLLGLFWVTVRPQFGGTQATLLSVAGEHHQAGRHAAAAHAYLQALDETPPPEQADQIFLDFLRCRIEAADALERTGRFPDATALCEDTLGRLKNPSDPRAVLMERDLLLRAATGRVRRSDPEGAYELLRHRLMGTGLGRALQQSNWGRGGRVDRLVATPPRRFVFAVLDGILPALSDPGDPAHADAARVLVILLMDGSTSSSAGEWLEGRGAEAVGWLASLLPAIDEKVLHAGGYYFYHYARKNLARELGRPGLRFAEPGVEDALAEFASDRDRSSRARGIALDLLIVLSDLPYRPRLWVKDELSPTPEEVLGLWREVRGAPRAEGHRLRVKRAIDSIPDQTSAKEFNYLCQWLLDHTVHLPEGVQGFMSMWRWPPLSQAKEVAADWGAWYDEEGGTDPLLWFVKVLPLDAPPGPADVPALVDLLSPDPEEERGWTLPWPHFALLFSLPDDSRGPVWRRGSSCFLQEEWRRALGLDRPNGTPRSLVVGHLALVDGKPEPELIESSGYRQTKGVVGATQRSEIWGKFPGEDLRRRSLLGIPGVPYPFPPSRDISEVYEATFVLKSTEGEFFLDWTVEKDSAVHLREVASVPVSSGGTWSCRGQPRLADVTEHSWPGPDGHTSTHFTLALPLEPFDPLPFWASWCWRADLEDKVHTLARQIEGAGEKRRAVLEGRSEDLDHLARIATLVPLPDARTALARLDGISRDEGMQDGFPLMVCARLLAGDGSVIDEEGFDGRLAVAQSSPVIGAGFWSRVLLANRDHAVQEVALSRLRKHEIPTGIGATLEEAAELGDFQAPSWLLDRVGGAGRRLRWGSVAWRLPTYAVAGIVWILACLGATLALRPLRTRWERVGPASLLFAAGVSMACLSLEIDSRDLLPRYLGYGAAALGAWVLALSTRGPLGFLTPLAFSAALALEWLLPQSRRGWGFHGSDQGQYVWAQAIAAALGICCIPFLARALDRGPLGVQARRPSWRIFAFWTLCGAPLIMRLNTWSHLDWVSAGRKLGNMEYGAGPRWVIPFAAWDGPAGIILTLAGCLGIGLILWEVRLAARRRAARRDAASVIPPHRRTHPGPGGLPPPVEGRRP